MKRWSVIIVYRGGGEITARHFSVEELHEIQDIVENGPDWNAIIQIRVTLARVTDPGCVVD